MSANRYIELQTSEISNDISKKLLTVEENQEKWNGEDRNNILEKIQKTQENIDKLAEVMKTRSNVSEELVRRVTDLKDQVDASKADTVKSNPIREISKNESAGDSLVNIKMSVERLKMIINEVQGELNDTIESVKEINKNIALIEMKSVSKSNLDEALKMWNLGKSDNSVGMASFVKSVDPYTFATHYEATRFSNDVNERSQLKETVCSLAVDLDNAIQKVKSVERLVKSRISKLEAGLQAKADNSEMMSAQLKLETKLQQLRNRLKILAPDDYLYEIVENRNLREEAAGLRRKNLNDKENNQEPKIDEDHADMSTTIAPPTSPCHFETRSGNLNKLVDAIVIHGVDINTCNADSDENL
ncbi:hypothetical protein ACTXT7_003381 [Hymenolepis weldensis]